MQRAILKSRLRFTQFIKVISEDFFILTILIVLISFTWTLCYKVCISFAFMGAGDSVVCVVGDGEVSGRIQRAWARV
jgi:hypothetical protein